MPTLAQAWLQGDGTSILWCCRSGSRSGLRIGGEPVRCRPMMGDDPFMPMTASRRSGGCSGSGSGSGCSGSGSMPAEWFSSTVSSGGCGWPECFAGCCPDRGCSGTVLVRRRPTQLKPGPAATVCRVRHAPWEAPARVPGKSRWRNVPPFRGTFLLWDVIVDVRGPD